MLEELLGVRWCWGWDDRKGESQTRSRINQSPSSRPSGHPDIQVSETISKATQLCPYWYTGGSSAQSSWISVTSYACNYAPFGLSTSLFTPILVQSLLHPRRWGSFACQRQTMSTLSSKTDNQTQKPIKPYSKGQIIIP